MVLWVPGVLRSPSPSSDGFVGIDRMVLCVPLADGVEPVALVHSKHIPRLGLHQRPLPLTQMRAHKLPELHLRAYSHDGPIRCRKRGYTLTMDQSDAGRPCSRTR
eukprot:7481755-Pyramimonas_sp.AAC.1